MSRRDVVVRIANGCLTGLATICGITYCVLKWQVEQKVTDVLRRESDLLEDYIVTTYWTNGFLFIIPGVIGVIATLVHKMGGDVDVFEASVMNAKRRELPANRPQHLTHLEAVTSHGGYHGPSTMYVTGSAQLPGQVYYANPAFEKPGMIRTTSLQPGAVRLGDEQLQRTPVSNAGHAVLPPSYKEAASTNVQQRSPQETSEAQQSDITAQGGSQDQE